ncbi:efflux RND transporter permease subunit [Marinigracilibium pacificum]|uniref:Efflux RND transporter permease subunit n=1 Tax=Marinigracilibium pacificum TaxID=2729599 RepID=A0A848ITB6_9BACT|nr:efflux RND transporter permease subunit [Marinigracilibium pacificum]NMM47587.1 efflux RND transporter permease subunit [Marinigracilibium pacificum]
MQITKISIKRSTIVTVVFSLLLTFGIGSYMQLGYELLPDISSPVVTVTTVYPGASPDEVETSVTKEIEDAVASLEGLDRIRSFSMENVSVVIIELVIDADADKGLQDAQRKIDAILGELPDAVDPPSLAKFNLSDRPIMYAGARSNLSSTEFYDLITNKIQPSLSRIQGVANIELTGGEEREIRINIDKDKMESYNLSILQVNQKIASSNMDIPAGKIKSNQGQVSIRLSGKYSSLDQIENLIISQASNGSSVRLKDIAEVQDTKKEVEKISRIDASESIMLAIQKQSDANAVEVSALTTAAMDQLENEYADYGLKFEMAQDSSLFTLDAADAVIHDLAIAIVLVAVVMLLFLHSIRNAIIVMIAVPTSIIATFTFMFLLGYTLNLMTLLGLSLVVGILVDDAIVVIENIYRHMEMGKNRIQASYDGIREIGATVTSITLVIVVVFVPLALSTGLVADIVRQFAVVVAISTLLSMLVAFTLIPLLSSRFSKLEHLSDKTFIGRFILGFEKLIDRFSEGVTGILKWSFNHKIVTFFIVIVLFFASVALLPMGFIGSEFVTSGDRGEFLIRMELPDDATIEQTNFATQQVESILDQNPDVTTYFTTIGQLTDPFLGTQDKANAAEINVKLVDKEKRDYSTNLFARKFKASLEETVSGVEFKTVPISIMGSAQDAPIQVVLTGPNLDSLLSISKKVENIIASVEGTADITSSVESGKPEINVKLDRDKMARLGLSLDQVGGGLRVAFNGNDDSRYKDGEYEYDINVRLDAFDRQDQSDIANLTFINNKGEIIRLSQFADIEETTGPTRLDRENRIAAVTVASQVLGRSEGIIGQELTAKLDALDMGEGVSYRFGGNLENQSEAFGTLGLALLSSLFFIYLIMVALYDSYVYPLVIMFSIPLAIIGALFALALAKQNLSIFSILGIIMLIGLVAKNAILVVDFTNQLKEKGIPVKDSLLQATKTRFRPILMTTIAMVIGMMPIALASGPGAEWKNSLGWVLIGGLISSMFLTLVVVPLIYYLFDRLLEKFGMNKKKVIEIDDTPIEDMESEADELLKNLNKNKKELELHH